MRAGDLKTLRRIASYHLSDAAAHVDERLGFRRIGAEMATHAPV